MQLLDVLKKVRNSDRILIRQGDVILYKGYCANVWYSDFNIDNFLVKNISIGTNVQKRQKYCWGVPVLYDRELDKPINHYELGELDFDAFLRIDVDVDIDSLEERREGMDGY